MSQASVNASEALTPHNSFEFERSQTIASLGIDVAEYRHRVTGAKHYHIASENTENVFLVALRTIPEDSTGVAHILEHTSLCGSEKYPVRDPFFMMTRRSLNTFMNAFTSSDWTAYPFASQNRKDFFNLLDVYLDAVFFTRLDELDFAQEGHRIEFEEEGNPDSPLVYKGVVFNEMKGAMSSPVSLLWQTLTKHLFPTTTYHFNSGGDPEVIPSLSYDELKSFYRSHYHPSNAIFMSFGDLPAAELQQRFEQQALARFEAQPLDIGVPDEQRYYAPVRVEEAYALEDEDSSAKTHVVLGWLLGNSTDLEQLLEAHLLSRVLLDNSASPLRFALESTELGNAPSPLCGLEDSNREMSFMCGLEGTEPEQSDAIEAMVLKVLGQVAEQGVEQSQLEAALHQLELSQREIGGDGYPYGLQLMLGGLGAAIHRGDPVAAINLDPVLESLHEKIRQPNYVQQLVQRLLLDNQHRVRLTLRPDNGLSKRRDQGEADKLAAIKSSLSDEQKQWLLDRAAALKERQNQQDDESVLPRVGLDDVPEQIRIPEGEQAELSCGRRVFYGRGTNGLVYQQLLVELPQLTDEQQQLLPYYTSCMTELGCGELSYQQAQAWQAQVSGGISAYTSVRGAIDDEQQVKGYLTLSGKALLDNVDALAELMATTFNGLRFDEHAKIRELMAQKLARKQQSITGSGHALAMMAASSGYSPSARLSERQQGLESIRHLKQLDAQLNDATQLQQFAGQLAELHSLLLKAPRHYLVVAEPSKRDDCDEALLQHWQNLDSKDFIPFALPQSRSQVRQAWGTNTQVNFCARSYATVPVEHEDAAALTVLGDFLRNGFLHRAIREQGGAYGSGASQDSANACFRFFSYRDPRLEETMQDFEASIDWLIQQDHADNRLEEAILGVVSNIDKPGSPAGEAKQAYHSALFGRTPAQRQAFRARILKVSVEDLKRVAATYLSGQPCSEAVVTDPQQAETLADQGFELCKI
ncbi:insulinase family protein [Motiliproteus sp.]|uniref:insulinase family protein n=1 Tax=Motiliproteus sp. TaxID=1898955 RepID=UPI003BAAD95C